MGGTQGRRRPSSKQCEEPVALSAGKLSVSVSPSRLKELRARGGFYLSPAVRVDRQHAYLFSLVAMRDVVRLAARPHWFPQEVRLERAGFVGQSRALQETFGERIAWGWSENAQYLRQAMGNAVPAFPHIEIHAVKA